MKKYRLIPAFIIISTFLIIINEGCSKHNTVTPTPPSGKVTATIGGSAFVSDSASNTFVASIGNCFGWGAQGPASIKIGADLYGPLHDTMPFGNGYSWLIYWPTGDTSVYYETVSNRSCGYYVVTLRTADSIGGNFQGWVYDRAGDSLDITNGSFLFLNTSTYPETPY